MDGQNRPWVLGALISKGGKLYDDSFVHRFFICLCLESFRIFYICPSSTRAKNYFWLEKYSRAFPPPQVTPVASDVRLFDVVTVTALSDVGLLYRVLCTKF
jgi:hypothetical protein